MENARPECPPDDMFIFVAYKPASWPHYNSDFCFYIGLTHEEVVERWAKCLSCDTQSDEPDWQDMYVIREGGDLLRPGDSLHDDLKLRAAEEATEILRLRAEKAGHIAETKELAERAEYERLKKKFEGKHYIPLIHPPGVRAAFRHRREEGKDLGDLYRARQAGQTQGGSGGSD